MSSSVPEMSSSSKSKKAAADVEVSHEVPQEQTADTSAPQNASNALENPPMDGDGDHDMSDHQMTPEEEYASLESLQAMYYYAVPERKAHISDTERHTQVEKIIESKIQEDFVKHKIGEPPQDIGANARTPDLAAATRLEWKKDKLRTAKRKVVYSYGLEGDQIDAEGSTLEALLEKIEENEENWGIDESQRKSSMSDEDWSKAKSIILENARADPAKIEEMRRQKAREEEDDAIDANAQASWQQEAAHAADPEKAWEATDKTVMAVRSDSRPKGLAEQQIVMASLILNWWEHPPTSHDMGNCTAINTNIGLLPNGKAWKIVPTEIELWQQRLRESLKICERECTDSNAGPELEKLGRCAITFTNKLRTAGLDWKMVLSRDTHRRIFTCLQRATSTQAKGYTEELANAYFAVREEQTKVLAPAISLIQPFMHSEGKVRKDNLHICTEQIKSLNVKLGELNLSLALPRGDHSIPTTEFEDVIEHYRCNRSTEAESGIAKMLYKVKLLHIPGFEAMCAAYGNSAFDQSQAYNEALDIARPARLSRGYDDVPLMDISGCTYAYEGTVMKTVGWGTIKRRNFYINQYGLPSAPIWRTERHMSKEWATTYAGTDLPFELKVTASVNRYGDETNRTTDKKRWDLQHIAGVCGVAFNQGPPEDPLYLVNPDTYETEDAGRWENQYVLVGWDFDGNRINIERRWETRTCLRERFGKVDADIAIYNVARKCQQKFEMERGGKLDFKDVSARPTKMEKNKKKKHDLAGSEDVGKSHDTESERERPKEGPKTRSSMAAIRTEDTAVKDFLKKISEDNSLSEKSVAAVMISRYGENWTNCFN